MRVVILIGSLISLWGTVQSEPVFAQTQESLQAQKINIAGRQRMLTQRLAKAACFIATFSDVERHRKILLESIQMINDNHKALLYGDSRNAIPAERNRSIQTELLQMNDVWEMMDFGARLLGESASLPGLGADLIAHYNLIALEKTEHLVRLMEMAYAETDEMQEGNVRALNVAARQRMLIQKAVKEFCLITYGVDAQKNKSNLAQTVHLFDDSVEDLRSGDPQQGIAAVPTQDIRNKLSEIKMEWQFPRGILLAVASGFQARGSDFEKIANSNEQLLEQADQMVEMLVDYYRNAPITNMPVPEG